VYINREYPTARNLIILIGIVTAIDGLFVLVVNRSSITRLILCL
jgi:hypothetical protein